MIKLAIIERIENYEDEQPFNKRYYLDNFFVDIFDELNVLLIPVVSDIGLDEICQMCDGLIITGSPNDVHPKYYGEVPNKNKKYDFDEFGTVKNIVNLFSKSNKPILGICAGIQELNVIFGGTLEQEIINHKLKEQSKHKIKIDKKSFLYEVYKTENLDVNSYHKQCIKDLAPDFKVTAISDDGIIEGIEKDNIVAVQWHPEAVYDIKLFKEFIMKYINK